MSLSLDFHPAVRDEINKAYEWYEQRQTGLGRDFLDEVERVLGEILVNPARYGFADDDIREGQLNRFPFAIYYRVPTDCIRILAVYHTSHDPSRWKARI